MTTLTYWAFGLFGVGLIFILFEITGRRRTKASLAWPSTQGRITSSRLGESYGDAGVGYVPEVEYEYGVAGQTYTGKRIEFGREVFDIKTEAMEVVSKYKVDTPVEVFYDPARPASAVLERQATPATGNNSLWFGIVCIVLSLLLWGWDWMTKAL